MLIAKLIGWSWWFDTRQMRLKQVRKGEKFWKFWLKATKKCFRWANCLLIFINARSFSNASLVFDICFCILLFGNFGYEENVFWLTTLDDLLAAKIDNHKKTNRQIATRLKDTRWKLCIHFQEKQSKTQKQEIKIFVGK